MNGIRPKIPRVPLDPIACNCFAAAMSLRNRMTTRDGLAWPRADSVVQHQTPFASAPFDTDQGAH